MHLINTSTFELTWFSEEIPPYAILSHTWGLEEVTFAGFGDVSEAKANAGFYKIQRTCEQALQDGLSYAWVDTCCINKESSAELSEAINCMFKWYRDAAICYAYIDDLPKTIELPITNPSLVKDCRWFSRGWTLQELLAPRDIVFFGAQWVRIGRKAELEGILEQVTGIPHTILTHKTRLDQVSVADRMNWAANRQTSREEDIAYCLMGIFDVNMPMMYGEGRKAFIRLQEEIVKQTQDDSMFAWRASQQSAAEAPYRGLFASSPREFASEDTITPFHTGKAGETNILGNGRVSVSCALHQDGVLSLKCFRGTDVSSAVGIEVISTGSNHFLRSNPTSLTLKPHQCPPVFKTMIFEKFAEMTEPSLLDDIYHCDGIKLSQLPPEISLIEIHPKEYRDCKTDSIVPLVYVMGKKIAFELVVDRKASHVDLFQQFGLGEKDGLATTGDIRILLILWVEQIPGTRSYIYYFNLEMIRSGNAESEFLQAERPPTALDRQEITVALSTIQVKGTRQKIHGHQMFNLSLKFVVREIARAEAEIKKRGVEERLEVQERAEIERTEVQERAKFKKELRWDIIGSLFSGGLFGACVVISTFSWMNAYRRGGIGVLCVFGIIFGLISVPLSCYLFGSCFRTMFRTRGRLKKLIPNRSGAITARSVTV